MGTAGNDGTGDSLRVGGDKINDNFGEVYLALGGDSDTLVLSTEFTSSGAIGSATHISCNSGSALALTLVDGSIAGLEKRITNKGAGVATITPTNFAQGTSFALAQWDACSIIFDGTDWFISGNQSEVTLA